MVVCTNPTHPGSVHRFRLLLVAFVAAACFLGYNWLKASGREDQRLNAVIWRLAGHCPANMTPLQWSSAVAWTNNLHCNSLAFQAPSESIRELRLEIEQKLDSGIEPIDMGTIHWIWDSYAAICDGGERYQRFRKQIIDEIEEGGRNYGFAIR